MLKDIYKNCVEKWGISKFIIVAAMGFIGAGTCIVVGSALIPNDPTVIEDEKETNEDEQK